jgi:hemoglobin-like flavoprotein
VTPEDIDRVLRTAEQVEGDTALSKAFYAVLFDRHPELRELFPDDMSQLLHKFVSELEALARALPDLSGFEDRARSLGARHVGFGVRRQHYPLVRDALIDALDSHLGADFGPEERASWTRAFNLLTEIMLEGAEGPELADLGRPPH